MKSNVIQIYQDPIIEEYKSSIDKDSIIKRAAFNGTGLVIWQDVFGCWLPFSKKQKQLIIPK